MSLTISVQTVPLEIGFDGVIRVSKTRVTLDTVITAFLEGATAEEIGEQYPALPLADIYSVIGYYLKHKAQINEYLLARQHQSVVIRQEAEKRFNPLGIRERLLARRNQKR